MSGSIPRLEPWEYPVETECPGGETVSEHARTRNSASRCCKRSFSILSSKKVLSLETRRDLRYESLIGWIDLHGDVPAWIRLRYGEETTRTRFVVEIKGIAFEFEQDLRVRDVLHGEPGPATQTYVCVHLYACAEGVLERRMKGLLVFSCGAGRGW